MSTGFTVESEDLRRYAGKLSIGSSKSAEIKTLVADADVGDQSWGVVGLFVKDTYSQLVGDLNSLLGQMEQGYESGANTFSSAANHYERYEDDVEQLLGGINVELDNA